MPKQPGDIANPNPNLSPEVSGGGGGGGGSKTNPPRRAQQDSAGAADGAAAPTHREKIVFALDFDGCLATACTFDPETGKLMGVDENHPLIQEIRPAQKHGNQVEIISFSNRQNREKDTSNAGRNKTGLASETFPHLITYLNTKNKPENTHDVIYDDFLLEQLNVRWPEGTAAKSWENKTDLLLHIAHHYPAGTEIHFFDDLAPTNKGILLAMVKSNPELAQFLNDNNDLFERCLEYINKNAFMDGAQTLCEKSPELLPKGTQITFHPFHIFDIDTLVQVAHNKKPKVTAFKKNNDCPRIWKLGDANETITGSGQRLAHTQLHESFQGMQESYATAMPEGSKPLRRLAKLGPRAYELITRIMARQQTKPLLSSSQQTVAGTSGAAATDSNRTAPAQADVACGSKCVIS
jgi:hypothetical protein